MAPKTPSLTFIEALKVVREYIAERDDYSVPGADIHEVIKPIVEVPEPVKSRLARTKGPR